MLLKRWVTSLWKTEYRVQYLKWSFDFTIHSAVYKLSTWLLELGYTLTLCNVIFKRSYVGSVDHAVRTWMTTISVSDVIVELYLEVQGFSVMK